MSEIKEMPKEDLLKEEEKRYVILPIKNDDIWIAMIMVAYPLKPSKGLGTYMVNCFTKKIKPNSISAIGINVVSAQLFKKVGMKIDYLNLSPICSNTP